MANPGLPSGFLGAKTWVMNHGQSYKVHSHFLNTYYVLGLRMRSSDVCSPSNGLHQTPLLTLTVQDAGKSRSLPWFTGWGTGSETQPDLGRVLV